MIKVLRSNPEKRFANPDFLGTLVGVESNAGLEGIKELIPELLLELELEVDSELILETDVLILGVVSSKRFILYISHVFSFVGFDSTKNAFKDDALFSFN